MHLPTSLPSPDPVFAQIHLGPLTIHTYALCILAGIAAAILIAQRRIAKRGGNPELVLDVTIWAVPLGLVGARLYHVFTHMSDYFYEGADPWAIVRIWDGGNAIYGSLIGGALGAYIACRRSGVRFLSFADAVAPGMLVAQAIGRLGNWFNHELFGLPTTLPWGLEIESSNPNFPAGLPEGTLFHPLFLYEMIWNLIGVAVIILLERRFRLRWGRALAVYIIWYGLGRSWLESIRIDPTSDGFLGIPANMWASFGAIALGVAILVIQGIRHREPEESVYLDGRAPEETEDADDAGAAPAQDGAAPEATASGDEAGDQAGQAAEPGDGASPAGDGRPSN
ncbi:prolipoprotein diacylglyceryl transferase [Zafaria sp. J156]|uniref:prolipoprotein diacylglyceryl transferase n=1 Tax=Zafaria sp. J156 TaxID=3116490 RepID=UPI002E7916D2|nr:prolipoprotein diacylglyceryl transferase [Zafaria sp. J156]MEE1622559.1 prolipoprotein diacylglyceryl transferase [Zafaria sp. J156]